MAEWWTYTPRDFLMFSAGSHARLLEQYNQDVWPLHVLMLAVGLLLLAAATTWSRAAQSAPLALAGAWAWVGWGYLWNRFAEINTAAAYLAVLFWLEAVLIAAHAWQIPSATPRPGGAQVTGAAVIAAALFAWPPTALLTGRGWAQAEFFGLAPEPTALATLGWLLATGPRHVRWLAVIPVLTILLGLAMLWLLYGPDAGSGGG